MKSEFSWQIFEKVSNIKFQQNPSSGSRVVPYGQTGRQTDMTKLIVAFHNFANAPKNTKIKKKVNVQWAVKRREISPVLQIFIKRF
jgi:hypothetical protein